MYLKEYGEEEIGVLRAADPALGKAICSIGPLEWSVEPNTFAVLLESIVSQQVSKKAAQTVRDRLRALSAMEAVIIHALSIDEVRACGMSRRKAEYIKHAAEAAVSGMVDFPSLHTMADEDVVRLLCSIRGVGTWTAEMLLIFSLGRMDVISFHDLAIRRGMMRLYGLESLSLAEFDAISSRYSPYSTIASLYLWDISK